MTISIYFESPGLAVIHGSGLLKLDDANQTKQVVHEHVTRHGPIRVLIQIEGDFGNLDALAKWDDIEANRELDRIIQQNIVRMAIVGDLRWRDSALLFFISALSKFPMEYFASGHKELAIAWLEA